VLKSGFIRHNTTASGSWYNNEVQHYTNRIENSIVGSGILKIVAKNYTNQGVNKQFTSARLNSKFAFRVVLTCVQKYQSIKEHGLQYGCWVKNINEDGAYFDLQGFGTTPWQHGEIDIMEHGIFQKPQDFIQVLFTHRHLLGIRQSR
jgi:hypothetical protein